MKLIFAEPPKTSTYIFVVSLLSTLVFNIELFKYVIANVGITTFSGIQVFLSVFSIAFYFTFVISTFIGLISPSLLRLFLAITTVLNVTALYFMTVYNVVLDRMMMGNIFNTRLSESQELFTFDAISYTVIVGILPAFLLFKVRSGNWDRIRIAANGLVITCLALLFLYANSTSWLWIDKHASMLGGKILPWSYIINSTRHYMSTSRSIEDQSELPQGRFTNARKTIVVLVIGETARSDNFSLYGYNKKTNPLLEAQSNLLILNGTQSCTTYTTGSLACILAPSREYLSFEALPTYLHRHGAEVIWRTNNWGEPPIEVSSYVEAGELKKACNGEKCRFDEVLLSDLASVIESSDANKILVVLHTKGSHGPSYYDRYPKAFNRFSPVCQEEEIRKCEAEELVNAYDNTIVYTDHFLAQTIKALESLNDTPSVMMYLSDHGESLGEYGLYLHGTPYTFAPDYQKNIPFLIWTSNAFLKHKNLQIERVSQAGNYSQFSIFHTILGAFDFESDVYDRQLDVLKNSSH